MKEKEMDYNKVKLDPSKPVSVPLEVYAAINNFVNKIVEDHTTYKIEDRFSWYSKATHEKLEKKGVKQEVLERDYYKNFDLDLTKKAAAKAAPERDEFSLFGLELQGYFYGIFKENVDNGNFIEMETKQPQTEQDLGPEIKETQPVQEDVKEDPGN
jgi:hypothetical protein